MLHHPAATCTLCSCALLLDSYLTLLTCVMPRKLMMCSTDVALSFRSFLSNNGCAAGAGAEQGSMQPNGQPKSAAGAPEKVSQLRDFGHEPQVPPLKLGILVFMFLCKYCCHSHSSHLAVCCSPSNPCGMQGSCCRLHVS